ncbi:hypothetical protein SAMN05421786_106134 [Chryseobacterium ureilyticum]|uniref:Uncharacterized protein n=1 Tax=Chryseobacterium ureilyticum TaxID=373668 RepID=A0A1N7PRS9_9FLAO|nr:hypothetical protein [Chryseobacterium ureilyticum]SIT13363.1 hypothetical protein SAMN05421786_106134 [Chryseobacterium ureilyticum]
MKINESLIESIKFIKSNEIVNASLDIGEAIIDSNLEDGILKDIPIIGTLINLNKGMLSIQDRIFSKKILSFLNQLKDIPEEKRIKAIQKIEDSKDERIKIGEKLIYLIDRADDHVKAEIIGVMFSEYIKENIDYEDFKRVGEIINKTYLGDLLWFLNSNVIKISIEESSDMISSGLFDLPLAYQLKAQKMN